MIGHQKARTAHVNLRSLFSAPTLARAAHAEAPVREAGIHVGAGYAVAHVTLQASEKLL